MDSNQNEQELLKKAKERVGFLVLGFWGICVAIHILAYALSSRKITGGYDRAVQKELERMKSEK